MLLKRTNSKIMKLNNPAKNKHYTNQFNYWIRRSQPKTSSAMVWSKCGLGLGNDNELSISLEGQTSSTLQGKYKGREKASACIIIRSGAALQPPNVNVKAAAQNRGLCR